jgi:ribosomal protein S21
MDVMVREGGIEAAIRELRKRVERSSIFDCLRLRRMYPNKRDRLKAKWRRANRRRIRIQEKRERQWG